MSKAIIGGKVRVRQHSECLRINRMNAHLHIEGNVGYCVVGLTTMLTPIFKYSSHISNVNDYYASIQCGVTACRALKMAYNNNAIEMK